MTAADCREKNIGNRTDSTRDAQTTIEWPDRQRLAWTSLADIMNTLTYSQKINRGRSMPIKVRCECGKRFRAKDEYAGKRAICPSCRREFLLVASGTETVDKSAAAPKPATPSQSSRAATNPA